MSEYARWQASQTEHRIAWIIAGCCIIIVLAAALRPQWFDFLQPPLAKNQQRQRFLPAPHRPAAASTTKSAPVPVAPPASTTRKPTIAAKPIPRNKPSTIIRANVAKPASSTSGLTQPEGRYYVQLGAFKESARAKYLADRLSHSGWQARITVRGRLHIVLVGPASTRAKAKQLQKAIAARLHSNKSFIIHQ